MKEFRFSGDVLCMGTINMDLVMVMGRLPAPGETLETDNFNTYPGGKGGNQAVAASRLGAKVRFLGKLGDDDFSDRLVRSLRDNGVDVSGILRDAASTAGIAMIRVDSNGQNSISYSPGANAKLVAEEVAEHAGLFAPGTILLITAELPPATGWEAVRRAKRAGMFVILDPTPPITGGIPTDVCHMVDVVKPNETEATQLTGVKVVDFASAERAAVRLMDMGFATPVVTLGDQGVVAAVGGRIERIAALKVKSVDTTAAGDVFSGALAARLACGKGVLEALDFAKTAAALSTTMPGAQTSIPSLEQVLAAM